MSGGNPREERALLDRQNDRLEEAEARVRQHPRYEVEADVELLSREGSTSPDAVPPAEVGHRIQNISLGGICIQTPRFEEVGTEVDLVIHIPVLASDVAIRGQVVWANREPPIELGIRYVDLDEGRKSTLRRFVTMVADDRAAVENAIATQTPIPARAAS